MREKFAITLGSHRHSVPTKKHRQARTYAWAKHKANRKARHRANQYVRQGDEDRQSDTCYILVREEKDGNGTHRLR